MYLHIGNGKTIKKDHIIGIFDMDNTTVSKNSRDFLAKAEKRGEVINVSYELPKSFIITSENKKNRVYISQISSSTLQKRSDFILKIDL